MGYKYISLWAYNVETVLAEKLETILSRIEVNGRMRDFYDIYLIYTKDWKNINIDYFRKAVNKTFSKREYVGDPFIILDIIKGSKLLSIRWRNYQRKNDYARNIDFEDIINCLEQIINVIVPVFK